VVHGTDCLEVCIHECTDCPEVCVHVSDRKRLQKTPGLCMRELRLAHDRNWTDRASASTTGPRWFQYLIRYWNHRGPVVKAEARSVRFRSCASRTFLTWLIDAYDMTPSHRRWALYESSTSDKMVGSGKEPQAIFMFLFGSHVGHIVYLKKKATQAPQARFFCISSCLQPLSVCRHQIRLKNTSIICAFWSQPHILSLHCNC